MARRRRNNEYDEMGYQDDPRGGGDYYPASDNGMTDPRPQRRRGDGRGRGGNPRGGDPRGGRGYDEPGEMGGGYDDYPAPQEQKKKGGALKVILIIILVLILMALSCLGGIYMSLTLAGQGKLPDNIVKQFNLPKAEPEVDSEDLLSSYGSEVAEAVKSGKVEELLEAEKNGTSAATNPATTTPGTTDPYGTGQQQVTDPTQQQLQQQQVTDPTQQQMQQQQVTDPNQQQMQQQQVTDPTQQQMQQQQVTNPNQQQMQQQQVVDPNQQQQMQQQ